MLAAALDLYGATGKGSYLQDCNGLAAYMAANEVISTPLGKVLHDGTNSSCDATCSMFKGPAYRALSKFWELTRSPSAEEILAASAGAIWELALYEEEYIFSTCWAGPPVVEVSEPQSAAAVMALNIFAMSRGPWPDDGDPLVFEAEDSAIRWTELEAVHEGFTGWGYTAGWDWDGQEVVFDVSAPEPGPYQVVLRYSSAAGSARRRLRIGSGDAGRNVEFPRTAGWIDYREVPVLEDLPAGKVAVAVSFEGATGSSGLLHLDHLRLVPLWTVFRRGDVDGTGEIDIADPIFILGHLFGGDPRAECLDSADADDSGTIDISDAVRLLSYLFIGGPEPPAPSASCGYDPTEDDLDCEGFEGCR